MENNLGVDCKKYANNSNSNPACSKWQLWTFFLYSCIWTHPVFLPCVLYCIMGGFALIPYFHLTPHSYHHPHPHIHHMQADQPNQQKQQQQQQQQQQQNDLLSQQNGANGPKNKGIPWTFVPIPTRLASPNSDIRSVCLSLSFCLSVGLPSCLLPLPVGSRRVAATASALPSSSSSSSHTSPSSHSLLTHNYSAPASPQPCFMEILTCCFYKAAPKYSSHHSCASDRQSFTTSEIPFCNPPLSI